MPTHHVHVPQKELSEYLLLLFTDRFADVSRHVESQWNDDEDDDDDWLSRAHP